MASNPYANKVEFAGQTIMDLTGDTATPSDVLNGVTFHDRSGAPQTGSMITHNVYDGLDSTSTDDALSANQGKVLNESIASLNSDLIIQDMTSSITGAVSNEFMRLYVINPLKMAILQYRSKGSTGITNGGTLCSIPAICRPSSGNIDTQGACWLSSGATSGVCVTFTCRVSSNGNIYALHPLNQTMYGHSGTAIWTFA